MMEETVLLSALGIVGTTVAVLVYIIKFLFEKLLPAVDVLTKNVAENSANITVNTKATISADQYLRDRNGRDAQLHEQMIKSGKTMHNELIKAVREIPAQIIESANVTSKAFSQHVDVQEVQKQIVATQKLTGK